MSAAGGWGCGEVSVGGWDGKEGVQRRDDGRGKPRRSEWPLFALTFQDGNLLIFSLLQLVILLHPQTNLSVGRVHR